jgi:hypothetical protein
MINPMPRIVSLCTKLNHAYKLEYISGFIISWQRGMQQPGFWMLFAAAWREQLRYDGSSDRCAGPVAKRSTPWKSDVLPM